MATGVNPFGGGTAALTFDAILNREPAPPRTLRPDLPAGLERLMGQALVKDRGARLGSASALLSGLRRVQEEIESGAPRDAPGAQSPAPDLTGAQHRLPSPGTRIPLT